MHARYERFLSRLIRHRRLFLSIVALTTVGWAALAARVDFDGSVEVYFLEDDPALKSYHDFMRQFQVDQNGVIGVFADDVFAPETMAAVARITTAVSKVPHVYRARSVANVPVVKGEDGLIELARLSKRSPRTRAESRRLRKRALENPLVRGHLVSPDGRAAAVVYEVAPEGSSMQAKVALVDALRQIMRRESTDGVKIRHAGAPSLAVAMIEHSQRDVVLLGPVTFAVAGLMLWLIFRRLSAALVALSAVGLALIWTFGVMGAAGIKINAVSAALVGLVAAIGVADAVHLLAHFYRELRSGRDKQGAIRRSAVELLSPCFFTSVTTAGGLLSLMVSDLRPLREFGWLAAMGVMLAFVLTMTVIPVVVTLLPIRVRAGRQERRPSRLLALLERAHTVWRAKVLVATSAVLVCAVVLISQLEIGASPVTYLHKDDPVRQNIEAIDQSLGGSVSVEVVATAPGSGLRDPAILGRLDRFQRWLEGQPGVSATLSVVDYIKQAHRAVLGAAPSTPLPASRELAAQLLMILESDEGFDSLVKDDHSIARVMARVSLSDARVMSSQVPVIEETIRRKFNGDGLQLKVTGLAKVMANMEQYLLRSQVHSFLLALSVVVLLMTLLLRSFRLVLLALIPNVAPIVAGLGFMVLMGFALDPGTVMVSCIAIGIAVDDTVHLLVRLQRQMKNGAPLEQAVNVAMRETARPIIVTSLVLAVGFSLLALGSYVPNAHFGIVSAVVILFALVADLVVLPAVLLTLRPKVHTLPSPCAESLPSEA